VSRAFNTLGFRAMTDLEDGLRKTIEWYEQHLAESSTAAA
jgi:nucleoside-diphosphate-sugar epimerase